MTARHLISSIARVLWIVWSVLWALFGLGMVVMERKSGELPFMAVVWGIPFALLYWIDRRCRPAPAKRAPTTGEPPRTSPPAPASIPLVARRARPVSHVRPVIAVPALVLAGAIITLVIVSTRQSAQREQLNQAAQQAALAEIEAIHGKRPSVSGWNGTVYAVHEYLGRNLKDPKSVEYIRWWGPSPISAGEYGTEKGWLVVVQYRARNSFGGMVVERQRFVLQGEKIISVEGLAPARL